MCPPKSTSQKGFLLGLFLLVRTVKSGLEAVFLFDFFLPSTENKHTLKQKKNKAVPFLFKHFSVSRVDEFYFKCPGEHPTAS